MSFAFLPICIDEMNEVAKFLKAEQKKQMWITSAAKMPERVAI